jgi:hypothetical protein
VVKLAFRRFSQGVKLAAEIIMIHVFSEKVYVTVVMF